MVTAKERKWKDGSYGPKVTDIPSVGNALGKKLQEKMGFRNNVEVALAYKNTLSNEFIRDCMSADISRAQALTIIDYLKENLDELVPNEERQNARRKSTYNLEEIITGGRGDVDEEEAEEQEEAKDEKAKEQGHGKKRRVGGAREDFESYLQRSIQGDWWQCVRRVMTTIDLLTP